jgi:precorrin-2 dehydrogenase/sirohydrochlorin ferrochelatase
MYYPLFINLKNKKVLIIGGGKVGSRRAKYLLKAGAIVTVISKEFNKELLKVKNRNLRLIKKKTDNKINYTNYFLIIISTNDKKINEKLTKKIKNKTLVCRADKHSDGNVVFPAVSKIGKNIVAFTTLGKNPKLSKKLKGLIENET